MRNALFAAIATLAVFFGSIGTISAANSGKPAVTLSDDDWGRIAGGAQ